MGNNELFKASSSKSSIKIIKMIVNRETYISELSRELKISKPVISRHIKILEKAGLVKRRIIGNVHLLYANVTVLETGIGNGGTKRVKYGRRKKNIEVRELTEILERTGQCDFLKMDCEGCGWAIKSSELKSFRRIEAEIHTQKHHIVEFEQVLITAGFLYEMEDGGQNCLIHAGKIKNVV